MYLYNNVTPVCIFIGCGTVAFCGNQGALESRGQRGQVPLQYFILPFEFIL